MKTVLLITLFAFLPPPALMAQCMQNNMAVPSIINVAIWPTQGFINSYPSESAARESAREFVREGVNALNIAFNVRNLHTQINIVFFPNTSVAPEPGSNLDTYTIGVKTQFSNQWPCIPIDLIVIPKAGSGHSQGRNNVALIANGHLNDPRSVAHEIMHGLGLAHASDADCIQNWSFMCPIEGPVHFTDHLMELMPDNVYTIGHCNSWKDITEERPDNYTCPTTFPNGVGITTDQLYLIRGCTPDRSLPMYTLTITGGTGGATGVKVRARYLKKTYDINLSTMGIDFNSEVTSDPYHNELRILENNVEKTFDLAEFESRTFNFMLSFNPDVGFTPTSNQTWVYGDLILSNGNTSSAHSNQQVYTTVSGTMSFFPNEPIFINGDVTLTSSLFTITNSSILVSSGGSITIPTNSNAHIKRGTFQPAAPVIEGCTDMWQGIRVQSNAQLELEVVTIKDAQEAVRLNVNGRVTATRSRFVNNTYGIYTNAVTGNGPYHMILRGNTFESDGNGFRPSYTNQSPLPSSLGFAGIYMDRVTNGLTMDAGSGASNLFSNLHYGIFARNSKFTVRSSHFSNIVQTYKPTGYPGPYLVGKGIYTENCTVDVLGSGIAAGDPTVAFFTTTNGIWTEYSTLTAQACYMRNVGTGIRMNNAPLHGYRIKNNDIEANGQGIYLTAQSGLPGMSIISGNALTLNSPISHGVLIMYNKDLAAHNSDIYQNPIKLNGGFAGVRLYATNRVNVTDNTVNFLGTGPRMYGVEVNGGDRNVVNCNDLLGAGRRGIYGEMAGRTDFICNTADGPDYGLYLDGVFTGTTPTIFVGDNKMRNNPTAGLLLGSNALIGPQAHRGNRWSNASSMTLARHLGTNILAEQSKFIVDANENAEYMPVDFDPFGWFQDIDDPEMSFICNPNCRIPPGLVGGEGADIDSLTATGALTGFEHENHSLWLAQKRLYGRLSYEDNPYTGQTVYNNFLSTQATGSAGQYAALQEGLRALFAVSPANWTALDTTEAGIFEYLDELADVESQLAAGGLSTQDSTDLETERAGLQTQIEQYAADLDTLRTTIQAARANGTAALYAQNTTLPATETYETNEKTVNAVVLQTLARNVDSLSSQQRSNLEAVAAQCPLADGEAVLHARALLALYDNTDPATYNDSTACYFLRPETTSSVLGNLTYGRILVYPNPASQVLHIRCETISDWPVVFSLFNAMGQLVTRKTITSDSFSADLPIRELPDGVYYYIVSTGHSGKVIIQH